MNLTFRPHQDLECRATVALPSFCSKVSKFNFSTTFIVCAYSNLRMFFHLTTSKSDVIPRVQNWCSQKRPWMINGESLDCDSKQYGSKKWLRPVNSEHLAHLMHWHTSKKTRCSNKVSSLTRSDHSSSSNVPDSCSRRVLSLSVSILISFVCFNPFLLCFLFSWSSRMQNTGLKSENLWIIGSFLEEHIIFPIGQHKVILWNRLTIINICLLWTTSKQCSLSSSVCKKTKLLLVTLHSSKKLNSLFVSAFKRTRLSPAQVGRWIQLHFFPLLRLPEHGRAATRLQSRRMALFVLEQASL